MKKSFVMLCIAFLYTSSSWAEDKLTFMHGTWAGMGTTSGMPAAIQHIWMPTLQGRFTTLRLQNRMTLEDGSEIVFEGNGYYRASDVAQRTGVWIDSNGELLPLQVTVKEHSVVVVWGSISTKFGKSIYRLLEDGALETSDFIANDKGEWTKFGHAILHRK